MKRHLIVPIAAVGLLLTPLGVNAQTLDLHGATVALGMERTTASAQTKRFRPVSVAGDDSRVVLYNGKLLVGTLVFRNGRLVWASRSWGAFDDDESPVFAGKVIGQAAERIAARAGAAAKVSTTVTRGAAGEWHKTTVTFRDRRLVITAQQTAQRQDRLYVDEEIGGDE